MTDHIADTLRIAGAQLAPVWLHRDGTIAKVVQAIADAAKQQVQLLAFPEAFVPGYPFWIEHTDGARFDSVMQKTMHAHYLDQAVQIEAGHLEPVVQAVAAHGITVVLGIIERPADRGGHSVFASCVTITPSQGIVNVHRKLMPTYEERLSWAPGDGHGLRTFPVGPFTLGALNCWENWLPLARAALYGQGEDLHVAIWPGSVRNTEAITRFLAREGRSYVMSVCGVLRREHIGDHVPHAELLRERLPEIISEGGTAIAAPDASWLVEPTPHEERLFVVDIAHTRVREERQNFDVAGHYGRPDVLQLHVNTERQASVRIR
ncbi:carbon-nitrogen hydrolase family protein [Gemmatimonas phototrophica]|uniref:Carbon-nitrogen hydrolase n=1 Tax=Gemmatimonas phototrophica TaxID=1379270 RepID=A0A143BMZ3_9BACT|nr:carbon-nitrogen hydrolase family protein [Gemmatimonas phototrophica]AMW05804.1 carbon-nitrogen hydrolase [Gemmatimonas phototrophica]